MGLRWWNEVDPATGDSHWVFESQDRSAEGQNATDKRFFWLALYAQPGWWLLLAIVAVVKLQNVIWLSLVGGFLFSFIPHPPSPPSHPPSIPPSPPSFLCGPPKLTNSLPTAIALVLTITNTLAFSRCDKFSQASSLASSAMYSGGMARSLAGNVDRRAHV